MAQTPVDISHPPADRAESYDRQRRAAEMRRHGHSWEEIAIECGYASRGSAYNRVKSLMIEARDLAYGEADLYRAESLERLMDLYRVAWPLAKAGSDKHMVVCLRIIKQMGDLRGENMPIKVEIGESDIDRSLRELVAELERRAAQAAAREATGSQAPPD